MSINAGRTDKYSSTFTSGFLEKFDHDWYIRVKFHLDNWQDTDASRRLEVMEKNCLTLLEGLRSRLDAYDIQMWNQRLLDISAKSESTTRTCYWLIGLPDIPSPELAVFKNYLQEWQKDLIKRFDEDCRGSQTRLQARVVPKKSLLEHEFRADTQDLKQQAEVDKSNKANRAVTEEPFKKKAGSNPQEVRHQFINHMMNQNSNPGSQKSTKIRPFRDILDRLRHDATYNANDYVIGCIDRKAGILEEPMSSWGKFRKESLVAYVKNVPDDCIVWDRAAKVDHIFNGQSK